MIYRDFFYSERKNTLTDEVQFCADLLMKKYNSMCLIGITFFVNSISDQDFFEKKTVIVSVIQDLIPDLPVSVISQSPGDLMAVETWVHNSADFLEHKNRNGFSYTLYADSFGKSLFAFGLSLNEPQLSLTAQATASFDLMQDILEAEGFSVDDVVRQWNYIPDILKTFVENDQTYQHYQQFNEIRQYYYSTFKQRKEYPAATGIGVKHGNISIDFVAVQKSETLESIGLVNPLQINAYEYHQNLLIGSSAVKKTPLFERAKYVGVSNNKIIYISGTASIIGEKTLGIGDVKKQTEVTLHNIQELVSIENICKTTADIDNVKYDYLRVYVKEEDDMDIVRQCCKNFFVNVPVLYVIADVCRDDLLVEIEGEVKLN